MICFKCWDIKHIIIWQFLSKTTIKFKGEQAKCQLCWTHACSRRESMYGDWRLTVSPFPWTRWRPNVPHYKMAKFRATQVEATCSSSFLLIKIHWNTLCSPFHPTHDDKQPSPMTYSDLTFALSTSVWFQTMRDTPSNLPLLCSHRTKVEAAEVTQSFTLFLA